MEIRKIDSDMTKIEQGLKEVLSLRKDMSGRIISSEELGEYIVWMISSFGGSGKVTSADINEITCSEKMNRIGKDIVSSGSMSDKKEFLDMYGSQLEKNYFAPGIDISVSRQLRYMPSHWHSNDYFEFYYNAGSTGVSIYFPEETVLLKPYDILLVSTSAVHACRILKEEDNILFYMIRKSTFESVFWNQIPKDSLMANFFRQVFSGGNPTSYLHFETAGDEDIADILSRIYYESAGNEQYKGSMLNLLMSTFFVLLLRRHENTVRLPRTKDFYWTAEFSAIISYIETHYTCLSLKELSEKFSYSEKQISRIVYKYLGVTYNRLILDLKMKRAAFLLKNENLSIDEIGAGVGYSTTSSFYRTFESYYNMTPLAYRKNNLS